MFVYVSSDFRFLLFELRRITGQPKQDSLHDAILHRNFASQVQVCVVTSSFCGTMVVRELLAGGVPWPMILLVLLLKWTGNISHTPIGYCELFAGEAAQSRALEQRGISGHTHDICNGLRLKI